MILYFTGTGNSAYVAEKLAAILSDQTLNLFDRIKTKNFTSLSSEKPWVVVCPTYAWQIPNILRDFLRKTKLTGNPNIYFVLTCGDSVGAAGKYAKKLDLEMDLQYKGLSGITMPENYIALFRAPYPDQTAVILENAEEQIVKAGNTISSGDSFAEHFSVSEKLLSGFIHRIFYAFIVKDKKFSVSPTCTGCGLCESVCPNSNITIENGKPNWHGNCTHCMACICRCPSEAIEYGKKSQGQIRYTCPGIF